MQFLVHYFLHLVFPGIVAYAFYRPRWLKVYLLLLATMLVDVDHLLATPIYQPCRCSIGFHPLHSFIACVLYAVLLYWPKTRIVALGLLMHMATDGIDCIWNSYSCG
ncbi:DUF6122 family protein [Foetidibacter luteolus]|uniref:DUF6122 family protein n=1 Tax=Foetidibacter luteolus TaxID=2608880 RepID=UPI00129A89E6|nr:DUF6122 family protein [Foetidibacter luteolus]